MSVDGVLQVLFVIAFSFFIVLLLLNLLIAVMTEAYEDVKENASARWCYMQMQMLADERVEQSQVDQNEDEPPGGSTAGGGGGGGGDLGNLGNLGDLRTTTVMEGRTSSAVEEVKSSFLTGGALHAAPDPNGGSSSCWRSCCCCCRRGSGRAAMKPLDSSVTELKGGAYAPVTDTIQV